MNIIQAMASDCQGQQISIYKMKKYLLPYLLIPIDSKLSPELNTYGTHQFIDNTDYLFAITIKLKHIY